MEGLEVVVETVEARTADRWLDQDFGGGLGRDGDCTASVREKLLDDPFED